MQKNIIWRTSKNDEVNIWVSQENNEVKGALEVDLMIFKQEGLYQIKHGRCNWLTV